MRRFLLVLMILLVLSVRNVVAAGFNLKSIGNLSVDGKMSSKWWYSGLNPTFKGEASPGANITVDIDGTVVEIGADSNGDWIFTSASALGGGEHSVSFKTDVGSISFVLVLGSDNVDWKAVENGEGEVLPTVGVVWPTMIVIFGGVVMLGGSWKVGLLSRKSRY